MKWLLGLIIMMRMILPDNRKHHTYSHRVVFQISVPHTASPTYNDFIGSTATVGMLATTTLFILVGNTNKLKLLAYHERYVWSYAENQIGGSTETQTPDIYLAKVALYQLSYGPMKSGISLTSFTQVIFHVCCVIFKEHHFRILQVYTWLTHQPHTDDRSLCLESMRSRIAPFQVFAHRSTRTPTLSACSAHYNAQWTPFKRPVHLLHEPRFCYQQILQIPTHQFDILRTTVCAVITNYPHLNTMRRTTVWCTQLFHIFN